MPGKPGVTTAFPAGKAGIARTAAASPTANRLRRNGPGQRTAATCTARVDPPTATRRLPQHGLNKRAHHWPIGRRPATVGSPADHFGQTPGPAPFSAAVSGQDTHAIMAAAGIHPDD